MSWCPELSRTWIKNDPQIVFGLLNFGLLLWKISTAWLYSLIVFLCLCFLIVMPFTIYRSLSMSWIICGVRVKLVKLCARNLDAYQLFQVLSICYYMLSTNLFLVGFLRILTHLSYGCVVAERISYERGETVGDTVGYKVHLIHFRFSTPNSCMEIFFVISIIYIILWLYISCM